MTASSRQLRNHLSRFSLLGLVILTSLLVGIALIPQIPNWVAPSVILLTMVLLAGLFLRSTPRLYSRIEEQLKELSDGNRSPEARLDLVDERDDVGHGWNILAGYQNQQCSLGELEFRLQDTLNNSVGQQAGGVLDTLPDAIIVTDLDSTVQSTNESFRWLLNVAAETTVEGEHIGNFLPLHTPRNERIFDERTAEPFLPVTFDLWKGSLLQEGVLQVSRIPRQSTDGNNPSCVWTVREVTQQRMADQARDEFVTTATHELRTPLTNILTSCEFLMDDETDAEQSKEFLSVINTESLRLARLVDELLDLSKMEAGAMTLNLAETDLKRVLEEVVQRVQPQMDEKRITFTSQLPEKLPKFELDKEKYIASLVNLLGNAAKYTPDGGQVDFQVRQKDNTLEIVVKDTGIGISEEELPLVFEKFFRSENEQVRDISGSGLGLAFTQEIIRRHGGEISATSELGKGTVFMVRMPILEGALA